MHRVILILLLVYAGLDLMAENFPQYPSPVGHPLVLAGSFGELRSTHFHAGIDIKPSRSPSDAIRCVEMGYVSRIKVDRSGYGKVVYIDHPDGFTTVYAHLSRFAPRLDTLVRSMQEASQSYEIEVFPEPGEIVFQQGDTLGILGNTGRSYGPHLHFEIRRTASESPLNPFLFGIKPSDAIKPSLLELVGHGLNPDFSKKDEKYYACNKLPINIQTNAWRMGLGIKGFDQMDGATNQNGIYRMELFVDDTLYYSQRFDEIFYEEMEQIKAHIDYPTKMTRKSTFSLLYKLPGNELAIVDSIKGNGIFAVYKEKPRRIKIRATDYHGNISILETNVTRQEQSKDQSPDPVYQYICPWNKPQRIKQNGFELFLPKGCLTRDERLNITMQDDLIQLGDENTALMGTATLVVDRREKKMRADLILANVGDNQTLTDYGSVDSGSVTLYNVQTFGQYKLVADTTPPSIIPIAFPAPKNGFYVFQITDNILTKGSARDFAYGVWINNQWRPMEFKSLVNHLYIPAETVNPGDSIRIVATDQKRNTRTWKGLKKPQ